MAHRAREMGNHIRQILQPALLGVTLLGAFWLGSVAAENAAVQGLLVSGGYLGVFLFSIINGFNVFVPIVTASFVPALSAAGLDTFFLILVISLGMTIADSVSFFLARAGRKQVSEKGIRIARSFAAAEEKRHWVPLSILFAWSFVVPLPNELVLVPIGLLGYRAYKVIPIIAVGNLTFNSVIGFGLIDLFAIFGT